KRIRQTPSGPGSKFIVLRVEVEFMHASSEMFRSFELAFNKCLVNDKFRVFIPEATLLPSFYLAAHRLEVALHAINTNRDRIDKTEVLGVFLEYGTEISLKRHVVADEHSISDRHRKAHGFIVGIP